MVRKSDSYGSLIPLPCGSKALLHDAILAMACDCQVLGSEERIPEGGSGQMDRKPLRRRTGWRWPKSSSALTNCSYNGSRTNQQTQYVSRTIISARPSASSSLWAENFVSGASASFLSKLILQPFDTTKTILQGSKEVRGQYNNLVECAVGLVRTKGTWSLYRGLLASVAVSAPSSAVFFTVYEQVKKAVETVSMHPSLPLGLLLPAAPTIAAAVGNVFSSVVRVPPEVIKQRVQAGFYKNMLEAGVTIWKDEGIAGFYTGYSSMVARDIPYAAVQFTVFETFKRRRQNMLRERAARLGVDENENLNQGAHLLSNLWIGGVSGAMASIVTSPIDVVKTRVMTQKIVGGGAYMGMRQTFARIWAEEGIVAFGRGLAPRVLYKVPASAVFLVCYEAIKRFFRAARLARESEKLKKRESSDFTSPGFTAPNVSHQAVKLGGSV